MVIIEHPPIAQYRLQIGRFILQTSSEELKQIGIAWLLISVAFAILNTNGDLAGFVSAGFVAALLASGLTVGIGFLFHELAHKIVAQHYRCWAEFRADFTMLMLAIAMSFFGFLFAAPGAVYIRGNITKKQNGIISLAGPFMNFVLALLFLAGYLAGIKQGILGTIVYEGFTINSWLGLFNMIPFGWFDGAKIIDWDRRAYFISVFALAFLGFVIPLFLLR